MKALKLNEVGFSLLELIVTMFAFAVISLSLVSLYLSLVHSTLASKEIAVASSLATNQMEYLKSLPYDSLGVVNGNAVVSNPLPASFTKKLDGIVYTVKTSINPVDDAYDGCGSYPSLALKQLYCRNYPPPSGAPATDTNMQDYKIIHVSVTNNSGSQLAYVDTQVSARVAETASSTGALFVSVLDNNGNPLSGATVTITNSTVNPAVNRNDDTDSNGIAIFYGLTPDTNGYDYQISATKSGYSSLVTIGPSGTLQPTYPSQKIFTQQSSYVTLTLKQETGNSLVLESTDLSGNPLANAKIYVKGGYKKYTSTSDTAYCYDNLILNGTTAVCSTSATVSDNRPVTDANGLAALTNLVPGTYIFCGDDAATSCSVNGTTYYLAAAVPYGGLNPFNPITVPTYDPANPPTTYPYAGSNYVQKVRLMLTSSSSAPRITNIAPYDVSQATGLSNATFTVNGFNLPCSSNANSCGTTVKFVQGVNTFTASCTGTTGKVLNCSVDMSGATQGNTQMVLTANGTTLTMPVSPPIGGIIVTP